MVNKKRLIKLIQKLIRIDSQNPGGDESEIAQFLAERLKVLGLKVAIYEFKKRRSNLVAVLKGKNKKHTLLISPHLDTVPAGKSWSMGPFSARIKGRRVYGLGSTDCKANVACCVEAIESLVEEKEALDYNLIFAATADEECGSLLGLIPLLNKGILNPDAAVVLDSDDFEIVVAQKGLMHFKVKIFGRRAHGAYPWKGVNAIDKAIDIIKEIKALKLKYRKNRYLRGPTINTGTIKGGDKVNIVADWCEFELDFRFLPGMSAQDFLKGVRGVIKKHAKKFKIEIEGIEKPYQIGEKHPLVVSLKKALWGCGIKPKIKGLEGASVITFFQDKAIPAVCWGVGSGNCAHTADEYARIDNLFKGTQAFEGFLKKYKFN